MMLKRPGALSLSLTKPDRPRRSVCHGRPTPQAAATAAITLSTWKAIVPLRVTGTSRRWMVSRHEPSEATMQSPSTYTVRWPWARCGVGTHHGVGAPAGKVDHLAGAGRGHGGDDGVGGVEHRIAAGGHVLHDHALEH